MCSNETPTNASPPRVPAMPFALDPAVAVSAAGARGTTTALLPIDQYRLQLYQYAVAERLRYPLLNPFPATLPCYPLFPRSLAPEEPKPQHSYIGLIAMAILSAPDVKLVLSDIYQHILDHYPYFRTRGPGWRNSIRHNLSLNDCFIKAGRSANGKGHYWAVHPANVDDFRKGDFRRRKAQRRVRKHMGLAVDEDGADSPSPPPLSVSPPSAATAASVAAVALLPAGTGSAASATTSVYQQVVAGSRAAAVAAAAAATVAAAAAGAVTRKRQFDVASLLAPDSGEDTGGEEDIDVVSSDHHHHHHHHTHFMHHQNHQQQYLQHQQLLLQQHHQDNQLTQLQQQQQQQQQTQVRHNWPMFPIVNYYQALLHHQVRPSLQTVGNGVGSGATNHPQEPAANANLGDA